MASRHRRFGTRSLGSSPISSFMFILLAVFLIAISLLTIFYYMTGAYWLNASVENAYPPLYLQK